MKYLKEVGHMPLQKSRSCSCPCSRAFLLIPLSCPLFPSHPATWQPWGEHTPLLQIFTAMIACFSYLKSWRQPTPNSNLWILKANCIFPPCSLLLQGVLSKWCKVKREFCLLVGNLAVYAVVKPPVQDPSFSLPALESFCNTKRQPFICMETAACVSKFCVVPLAGVTCGYVCLEPGTEEVTRRKKARKAACRY